MSCPSGCLLPASALWYSPSIRTYRCPLIFKGSRRSAMPSLFNNRRKRPDDVARIALCSGCADFASESICCRRTATCTTCHLPCN